MRGLFFAMQCIFLALHQKYTGPREHSTGKSLLILRDLSTHWVSAPLRQVILSHLLSMFLVTHVGFACPSAGAAGGFLISNIKSIRIEVPLG